MKDGALKEMNYTTARRILGVFAIAAILFPPSLRADDTVTCPSPSDRSKDASTADVRRQRRILYNLDGDACMAFLSVKKVRKPSHPITPDSVKNIIDEIAFPGSQVDTLLLCVNAQAMYFPTKVGTMRGALTTPEQRRKWPAQEQQRFENLQELFHAGIDPYAILLAEAKRRGMEALLTFRMNDAHGFDFLKTQFWIDHPERRLGNALDFASPEVCEYTFRLIEEAVRRYDCDGLELDFNRNPAFFRDGNTEERVATINTLVERVRTLLDDVGRDRGRRLVLAARVPSNFGTSPPSYPQSRAIGCDPVVWSERGWIDFLTISEFLWVRYDLPIRPWKTLIQNIPIYGGIEFAEGGALDQHLTREQYQRAAHHLWSDGADGIYLFNLFSYWTDSITREPSLDVLQDLGTPTPTKDKTEKGTPPADN